MKHQLSHTAQKWLSADTIARTECARVNHFAIANKRRNCHYSALSHSHTAPLAARRITYSARSDVYLRREGGREGGGRNVKEDSASARSPTVVWVESKRRTLSLVMGASYAAQSYLYGDRGAPQKAVCARKRQKQQIKAKANEYFCETSAKNCHTTLIFHNFKVCHAKIHKYQQFVCLPRTIY